MCVLGGFIGEFLLVISTIEEFAKEEKNEKALSQVLKWDYNYVIIFNIKFY